MNSLTTQLHVPPSEARNLAEELVGGKFNCPLGGDYALINSSFNPEAAPSATNAEELPPPGERAGNGAVASATSANARQLWASTAVTLENRFLLTEIPADYEMPMLSWFRGISADMARGPDELWAHAELSMVHLDVAPESTESGEGFKLPSLGQLFSDWGNSKDEEVKPTSAVEDIPPPAKE
jgi:hypothetical protein